MRHFIVAISFTATFIALSLSEASAACYTFTNSASKDISLSFVYNQPIIPPEPVSLTMQSLTSYPNAECFNQEATMVLPGGTVLYADSGTQPIATLGGALHYVLLGGTSNSSLPAGHYTFANAPQPKPANTPTLVNGTGPVTAHRVNPDPVFFPESWFKSGFLDNHQYKLLHLRTNYYHVGDCDLTNGVIVVRDDGAAKFRSGERSWKPSMNGDQWHFVVYGKMDDGSERGGPFDGPTMTTRGKIYDHSADFSGQYSFRPGDFQHIVSVDLHWPQC